jgi:hypothetical protein
MKIKLRDSRCAGNGFGAGLGPRKGIAPIFTLALLAELYEQIKNNALSHLAWITMESAGLLSASARDKTALMRRARRKASATFRMGIFRRDAASRAWRSSAGEHP